MGCWIGWLRLNYKQWKPAVEAPTQLMCEEALAKYKSDRELSLEGVCLPPGVEPHPGHSVKQYG